MKVLGRQKADCPKLEISITHEPAVLWQKAPHSTLTNKSGQHMWFRISSGECPRTRMEYQVEVIFPHSALSIYLQQLALGNIQGLQTPTR